jgi:hypothetical protein
MYYKTINQFFTSVIGYDGNKWEGNFSGTDYPWLSHDMEKMIDNQVGYPSLMQSLIIISYLGYCINPNSTIKSNPGNFSDFKYFCNNYLNKIDKRYEWNSLGEALYYIVRGKLAHVYFTKNTVTTRLDNKHLNIIQESSDHYYIFISVQKLWEDMKKAIEFFYKDISSTKTNENNFLAKLDSLDNWQWRKNKDTLESKYKSTISSLPSNNLKTQIPDDGQQISGASGSSGPNI